MLFLAAPTHHATQPAALCSTLLARSWLCATLHAPHCATVCVVLLAIRSTTLAAALAVSLGIYRTPYEAVPILTRMRNALSRLLLSALLEIGLNAAFSTCLMSR